MSEQQPLKVIAGTPDRPLIIGDIEIPCYVLEDETRVLSSRWVSDSNWQITYSEGRNRGHVHTEGMSNVDELPLFLRVEQLKSFIFNELVTSTTPVTFQAPSSDPITSRG